MSAPGIEGLSVVQWALGRLQGNYGVSAWYQDEAPPDARYPFGVVSVVAPVVLDGVGTTDWLAFLGLTVRLTTKGRSYVPLVEPWKAAYALLTADGGNPEEDVALGGTVLTVRRTTGLQYPERTDGTDYRHLGASFSVYAQ